MHKEKWRTFENGVENKSQHKYFMTVTDENRNRKFTRNPPRKSLDRSVYAVYYFGRAIISASGSEKKKKTSFVEHSCVLLLIFN